ncbi:MAG: type III pantothenate kinase, partial [Chloroflexi bacterium]|nr:type III pantothenate kinase [Chloroflexota bacterium]
NVTYGVFDGEVLRATWRMATDVRRQPDEYFSLNVNLLLHHGLQIKDIKQGVLSSVVPPLTTTFEEVFEKYFKIRPVVVGTGTKTGIRVLYENPREVGADRIAHAVAAYHLYGGPLIIIDFGTATVFDAITDSGDYLGGAIAPGINLAAEALFTRTSKLPRIELARPKHAIGRNTVASMQSGLFYGYVGLIEGMVARFQKELGGGAKVVATGGLARHIAQDTTVIDVVNYDLVLIGLRLLHEQNEKVGR